MSELLDFFYARQPAMVAMLRRLAELESPSHSPEHLNLLGEHIQGIAAGLGASVEAIALDNGACARLAKWNADAPGAPILLLMHMDTVWPVGTLATMPLREEGGLLFGPGVADMKGGIVVALETLRGLIDRDERPNRPIWALFTPDEEIGSPYSRGLIQATAAQVGLVLVLEPGTPSEAIKSWRKGIGGYTITLKGRASHSGFAPEAGINALVEAAHKTLYLQALNDLPNGTSVSVTKLNGGFAINVIPPEATLYADVRFLKMDEAARIDAAIRAMEPTLPGAEIVIEGGIDRGPMEYNEQMRRVVAQVKALGKSLGLEIIDEGSGGASDGNFTAAMGVPTLDGLGPAGHGLHAVHEQVQVRSLPRRAALLAVMLREWDMAQV